MDADVQNLPRHERRKILKQLEKERGAKEGSLKRIGKWLVGLFLIAGLLFAGYRIFKPGEKGSSKPLSLPGEVVNDLGRDHVEDGTKVEYNSNPPTSGSHYADWTKAGVYDKPVSDGHLVHSLEHGYVIVSYNCESKRAREQESESLNNLSPFTLSLFYSDEVYAHEEELITESGGGPSNDTGASQLDENIWQSPECKDLVAKLTQVYEKKGKRKLIIIPRPGLDTKIALTAWARIDKFDDLDEERIIGFIDAYRDKGPEKTVE